MSNTEIEALMAIRKKLNVTEGNHGQLYRHVQECINDIDNFLAAPSPTSEDKDAEIVRLKELIKKAWNKSYDLSRDALEIDGGYYKHETFSAFKNENNL
jgi:hypothetical protein